MFKRIASALIFAYVLIILGLAFSPIVNYFTTGQLQMPVRMWFPFDENDIRIFPLVYIWTVLTCSNSSFFVCGYDLMVYGMLELLAAEFKMLGKKFSEIEVKKPDTKQKIIRLIAQHNELISVAEKLERIVSLSSFVGFVGSMMLICFGGFQFIYFRGDFSQMLYNGAFLSTALLQNLLMCYFGQKLVDSSSSVADCVYEMEWYSIDDLRVRKMVQLVIMRAQKANKLTALNFVPVSLGTFLTVSCIHSQIPLVIK
jgi:hypothetical protein